MTLEEAYENLVTEQGYGYLVTVFEEGYSIKPADKLSLSGIHLYPGSFQPVHDGHLALYESIVLNGQEKKAFEISLHRRDKEFLEFAELDARLRQFAGVGPVLITNANLMIKKAGVFPDTTRVYIHVGVDTADRMYEDYGGVLGLQGIAARFVVYERAGKQPFAWWSRKPVNFQVGRLLTTEHSHLSSTELRNAQKL